MTHCHTTVQGTVLEIFSLKYKNYSVPKFAKKTKLSNCIFYRELAMINFTVAELG